MSGAGRKTIYKDMKTGAWPNGLTVDHFEKRIVWTDARFKNDLFFCISCYLPQIVLTKSKHVLTCMYRVYIYIDIGGDFCLFFFFTMAFFLSTNQIQAYKIFL